MRYLAEHRTYDSMSRKWSAGAMKGRTVLLPGTRPAMSAAQYRSLPVQISGSTSVRLNVWAIAHALRICAARYVSQVSASGQKDIQFRRPCAPFLKDLRI